MGTKLALCSTPKKGQLNIQTPFLRADFIRVGNLWCHDSQMTSPLNQSKRTETHFISSHLISSHHLSA
jgi:hypothetical protein